MSDASHAELNVFCTVGSAVCSVTVNTKHCYVSMATLLAFITLSTATDILQQYKGNGFLRFHGKNCYIGAPNYYITSTQPSLVRLRVWNLFHLRGSSTINFQLSVSVQNRSFDIKLFIPFSTNFIKNSLWIKPTDALISNLHVSGSLSAHHQEFLAVHRHWYSLCSMVSECY
jgi:hypothetical protein